MYKTRKEKAQERLDKLVNLKAQIKNGNSWSLVNSLKRIFSRYKNRDQGMGNKAANDIKEIKKKYN